jgi:hypothetical protein
LRCGQASRAVIRSRRRSLGQLTEGELVVARIKPKIQLGEAFLEKQLFEVLSISHKPSEEMRIGFEAINESLEMFALFVAQLVDPSSPPGDFGRNHHLCHP